jgi:E3 ubiquitin-protein ligase MYCBP2
MMILLGNLCQSSMGCSYLSKQDDLVVNLLSLLHTGSIRIQKQVIIMLRQLLPHIDASQLASLLGISDLPIGEGTETASSRRGSWSDFDPLEASLLDILLSLISKALTIQTKVKGISSSSASVSVSSSPYHHVSSASSSTIAAAAAAAGTPSSGSKNISTVTLASSIHPKDDLKDRWFMRGGSCTRSIAEMVITLIKDMSHGKFGKNWSTVVRDSITENILNMTRLREEFRNPSECMRTPTLWLELASLCVMDEDQADRLSNWMPGGGSSITGSSDCRHHRVSRGAAHSL